jgi:hypothetical protein
MNGKRESLVNAWREMEERFDQERRARRHASALHSQAKQFRRALDNPDKASRYLGVTRSGQKWVASIRRKDERVACSLGSYQDERDAAIAYDVMALALFGSDVQTNFSVASYGRVWRADWMKLLVGGFASQYQHDRKDAREALRVLVGKLRPRVASQVELRPQPTS